MTSVGFTGTQQGMTPAQRAAVFDLLNGYPELVVHHGDCIGADAQFHAIALASGCDQVVIHPPEDPKKRAHCQPRPGDVVRVARPYLVRNQHIVHEADVVIAAPAQAVEQLRSGTWSTIRYARRYGALLAIVYPDGTIRWEGLLYA
jgi:hypothetical protein